MTDTQGNSEATQAAREAAERVRASAADGAESSGATAEQIADEVSAGAQATKSDIEGRVNEKAADGGDGAQSAASDAKTAARQAADAAVEAAKAATASIKDAAADVDFDGFVAQTKTVAGEWTDKLKQTYRERPGVVIAAAAGALVVLGAIVRSIGRR